MEIVFLDVGNSNAAYINIDGRYNVIVDAGGPVNFSGNSEVRETRLCDYLSGRGVRAVDLAIATHGDYDHIQGFWAVLEGMPVRRFMSSYMPGGQLEKMIAFARESGVEIIRGGAGDCVRFGADTVIEVLSPNAGGYETGPAAFLPPNNDSSLVIRVIYGDMKALFCGDIGMESEIGLVNSVSAAGLSSQLMSVPHHGSKNSSGAEFLQAVSPEAAVAGVGKNNYGHPAAETISRYADAGAVFLRTDLDGMVVVMCGREGINKIKRFNGADNQLAWRRY
jgi:competence protein ComEC